MNSKKTFLTTRAQMAIVGVGLWFLLALWSLSAFWRHIDDLGETYQFAAKCGASGGEFALLALVLWHCFSKHIGVRRWAAIFGFLLAAIIVTHSGALRGMGEARTARHAAETRLAESLTKMSREQSAAIAESAGKTASSAATQRERLALGRSATAQQAEVAKAAQSKLASEIVASEERVKESSILPRWYLDGWMYSVIFIFSLAFVGIICLLMMNTEDVDADFDGIPDRLQGHPRNDWERGAVSDFRRRMDEPDPEETAMRPARRPAAPAYAQTEAPPRRQPAGFAPPPETDHGAHYMETRYPNRQSHSAPAPSLWQRLRRRAGRG